MRFTSFGLVALSSFFAASSAAPTVLSGLPIVSDVTGLPLVSDVTTTVAPGVEVELNRRTDSVICEKLKATLVEVKEHTAIINSTISGVTATTDKSKIIISVKSEVTLIVQLLATVVGEVTVLLTDVTTITGSLKNDIISVVVALLVEILMTLNGVITALKISESTFLFFSITETHTDLSQLSSSSSDPSSSLCSPSLSTSSPSLTSSSLTSSRSSSVSSAVLPVFLPTSLLVLVPSSLVWSVLLAVPSALSVALSAASCKYLFQLCGYEFRGECCWWMLERFTIEPKWLMRLEMGGH
jgi:hypothetical protein